MHVPVLLNEILAALDLQPGDHVIDGTVDGGGHASAMLAKIMPKGKLLGVEWDAAMLAKCRERLEKEFPARSMIFARGNYADLPAIMAEKKFSKADALLIDLGFSSEQLEASGRGFSFAEKAADEPLLMTYDDSREPLRDMLRHMKEEEIANVIFELGGERRSRQIAKAIAERGRKKPIMTAGDLAGAVRSALPRNYERGRIDPATRTFQALRIHANGELENLKRLLDGLSGIMAPGGRAAIITFHSIEDRIVKNAFRDMAKAGNFAMVTKKPVAAGREEIRQNPRSRSAKVRVIEAR